MSQSVAAYSTPSVRDLGRLEDVTRSHYAAIGSKGIALAASLAASVVGPHTQNHQTVQNGTEVVGGVSSGVGGGGSSPSVAAHTTNAGHGSLPFTGYAVALSAGLGVAMAASGEMLRRRVAGRRAAD